MKRHRSPNLISLIFAAVLAMALGAATASAQTSTDTVDETPAFANPAQAQKAENISEATATEPNQEDLAILEDAEAKASALEAAEADLAAAQQALDQLPDGATPEEADLAAQALADAQDAYDQTLTDCDQAQALADATLAELAGVPAADIYEMRKTMGWGQICLELGIDPSVVGLGQKHQLGHRHQQRKFDTYPDEEELPTEIQAMTQRNLKTGWSKGHGYGIGRPADHTPAELQTRSRIATQIHNAAQTGNTGKGLSHGRQGANAGGGGQNGSDNSGKGGGNAGGNSSGNSAGSNAGGNAGGNSSGNSGGSNAGGNAGGNSGGNSSGSNAGGNSGGNSGGSNAGGNSGGNSSGSNAGGNSGGNSGGNGGGGGKR